MQIEDLSLLESVKISNRDSLLIIDMQNDFLPGGALEVSKGDKIIPNINNLALRFHKIGSPIVLTQDWHPPDHHSFASTHSDKNPGDFVESRGIGPVLWPDHCIQGSYGADFAPDLNTKLANIILRKGYHKTIDSYSAFLENDKSTETGLRGFLRDFKVQRIFLCGLALDYCVYYSAIDAKLFGDFEVIFVIDCTKPVGYPDDSVSNALNDMVKQGIDFIFSHSVG